jgi:F0F1-type ATP synthase assembly protein I
MIVHPNAADALAAHAHDPTKMSTKRPWKAYGRYGSVGIELVLSILIGVLGGRWLDDRYAGGHGWLAIFGLVVGAYAGFRQVFRAAKQMQRESDRADREEAAERAAWGERVTREAAQAADAEKSVASGTESSKTGGDDDRETGKPRDDR